MNKQATSADHPLDDQSKSPPPEPFAVTPLATASSTDESDWLSKVRADLQPRIVGRIGPYELVDRVGQGGQGVVYRARQPGTHRVIAIKRLSAGAFATADMQARFEREIEATVALDHPNIVTVFGTEIVDGQTVLAMKWIDGVPIDRWTGPPHASRRAVRDVLGAFVIVCDAVQHAHQRGVIHRDLKPSNILVDKDDRPQVLDFGLAKFCTNATASPTLTVTGQFLGTPAYAAPEQLRGNADAIDARADVYSLGVVLYQVLTGQTPHQDCTELAVLFEAIEKVEPQRPSQVRPELDSELDAIVLTAIAKNRELRYPSVDALSEDVRRYLAGDPVAAHAPSRLYRLGKKIRRQRRAIALTTTILFLTVALVASALSIAGRGGNPSSTGIQSGAESNSMDKVTLTTKLEEQGLARFRDADYAGAEGFWLQRVEIIRNDPTFGRMTRLKALKALATAVQFQGRYENAVTLIEEANVFCDLAYGVSSRETAGYIVWLGNVHRLQHRDAEAEQRFNMALEVYMNRLSQLRTAEVTDRAGLRDMLQAAGVCLVELGRVVEAEEFLGEAVTLHEAGTIAAASNAYFGNAYVGLGQCAMQRGRYREAEEYFLKCHDTLTYEGAASGRHYAAWKLIALYEIWGKHDKAEEWRQNLKSRPLASWVKNAE